MKLRPAKQRWKAYARMLWTIPIGLPLYLLVEAWDVLVMVWRDARYEQEHHDSLV